MKKIFLPIIVLLIVLISSEVLYLFFRSKNKSTPSSLNTNSDIIKLSQNKVKITSTTDRLKLISVDSSLLNKKLDELKYWDSTVLFYDNNKAFSHVKVNALVFELTDVIQPLFSFSSIVDNQKYIYEAYGMDFNKQTGLMTIKVFLDKGIIAKSDSSKLNKRLSVMILRVLYYITHPPNKINEQYDIRFKGMSEFIGKTYFITVKK